jgi:hypothetical protein
VAAFFISGASPSILFAEDLLYGMPGSGFGRASLRRSKNINEIPMIIPVAGKYCSLSIVDSIAKYMEIRVFTEAKLASYFDRSSSSGKYTGDKSNANAVWRMRGLEELVSHVTALMSDISSTGILSIL